ncbi:LrgB family protein [Azospira inquinata]|uniref:LrgB family protein n=1 Tax=Azospira inquinata TaxID=2785627 RepID=A0A975XVB1_9RHOO|nr:LrgB family protein [Azospira inquinata]QWT44999.1 LrgB family protein [Azospira inquinata]QWT49668.1 LrgB family protein [Azospira inquinata]
MSEGIFSIWVYLETSPLLWLTLTLLAYQAGCWLFARLKFHPLANPVFVAVVLLVVLLMVTGTPYQTYFSGAQFVHFLLGPATVALALPLYAQFHRVKALVLPLALALLTGSLVAALSAVLIAKACGASLPTLLSLGPKSVTTPIAMGIAERTGGIPSLAAVMVILTGILGAVAGPPFFRLLGIRDDAARGFAMGLACHGVGTARAFQWSEQAGAFAALAMGLNGALTALLLPLVLSWIKPWLA